MLGLMSGPAFLGLFMGYQISGVRAPASYKLSYKMEHFLPVSLLPGGRVCLVGSRVRGWAGSCDPPSCDGRVGGKAGRFFHHFAGGGLLLDGRQVGTWVGEAPFCNDVLGRGLS